jgi:CDGSH-type Zn-finger protein
MAEQEVVIIPHNNGPYEIRGRARIVTQGGRVLRPDAMGALLCRCGRSGSKPFCDGTHAKVGFQSDLDAPPAVAGSGKDASHGRDSEREPQAKTGVQ